eukprot:4422893-Alexandrium_andersonii.AAC.1
MPFNVEDLAMPVSQRLLGNGVHLPTVVLFMLSIFSDLAPRTTGLVSTIGAPAPESTPEGDNQDSDMLGPEDSGLELSKGGESGAEADSER